jgi:hypothetical protein
VRTRWRSVRDVVAFVIRREWVYVVTALAVVLSLLPLLPGWPPWAGGAVAAAALVIGFGTFVRDTRHLARRRSSWQFRRIVPAFAADELPQVPFLPDVVHAELGAVATNATLDEVLAGTPLPLRSADDPYLLPLALSRVAAYLLRRTTSARWPFNGPCVRLDTDLSVDGVLRGDDVVLREVSFFDLLCSNELTGWQVHRGDVPWDFNSEYVLDRSDRLMPLAQSELANAVGVSTVAITTDGHLLLTLQAAGSSASAERWAPSGSGSLEPQDLAGRPVLQAAVAVGMERELREECGLLTEDVGWTRLVGYGRWLDRGGKPEFFAVTALTVPLATALSRRSSHLDERLWTQSVAGVAVDLTGQGDPGEPVRWQDVVPDPRRLRGSMSVPLEATLVALARALRGSSELVGELTDVRSPRPGDPATR